MRIIGRTGYSFFGLAALGLIAAPGRPWAEAPAPGPPPTASKPATAHTIAANEAVADYLNFADTQDFEDAQKGLIDAPATLTIKNDKGDVVWDMESYKQFIGPDKPAPDTVNPSLWRNAQLNVIYGLFKVTDHIYQVRGYDLSNASSWAKGPSTRRSRTGT